MGIFAILPPDTVKGVLFAVSRYIDLGWRTRHMRTEVRTTEACMCCYSSRADLFSSLLPKGLLRLLGCYTIECYG